jgi:hypothetical protein
MTRKPGLMFFVLFLTHMVLSWFTYSYCAGVSMALLDSGHTQAPLSLRIVCLASVPFQLPLLPFWDVVESALNFNSLTIPSGWLPIPLNSLLAVSIIYILVYAFKRARYARTQKT